MLITKIYKLDNVITLKIDNSRVVKLYNNKTLLDADLYVGKKLSDKEIKNILILDLKNYAIEKTITYLSTRLKSSYDVNKYIKKHINNNLKYYKELQLSDNEAKQLSLEIFAYLERKKYIDDYKFAKAWIKDKKSQAPVGKNLILLKLKAKKINKKIIDDLFVHITDDKEIADAKILARKKLALIHEQNPIKRKFKLQNYLIRRGFDYSIVYKVIKDIL